MGKETTPKIDDVRVIEFCREVAPASRCSYVQVITENNAIHRDCFNNVSKKIAADGGTMQLGWTIWLRPNVLLSADCHAVWVNNENVMIDITPQPDGEERILFLPDNTIDSIEFRIPSKYKALTKSPLVAEFVELLDARGKFLSKFKTSDVMLNMSESEKMTDLVLSMRIDEINVEIKRKVGRNASCPCLSEMKYKKCCGA